LLLVTEHYDEHFGGLMDVLDGLGVPAAHERRLKVISAISADLALRGSTDLIYILGADAWLCRTKFDRGG